MRQIVLSILLLGSTLNCIAQDPDLYRTWYLYELQSTDLNDIFIVNWINPPIQPTLTIEPNLEFSGTAACNDFSGTYEFVNDLLERTSFDPETEDCGVTIHTEFEVDYFDFLNRFYFEIIPEGDGLRLECGTILLGYAIFRDRKLSIDDIPPSSSIKLFPNPVSDKLMISSEGVFIESIQVYSINGDLLLTEKTNTESLNVSNLSEGIYFVEINTEIGRFTKKFIKE